MNLKFDTVYRVDRSEGGEPFRYEMVVTGIRHATRPGDPHPYLEFRTNSSRPVAEGYIAGRQINYSPGETLIRDLRAPP